MNPSGIRSRILWLTLFGVGFGTVEAAVVVYLRALYYPDGFGFPLALPETRVLGVEVGREAATLLMLFAVARLGARTGWGRFGAFCFAFGVWDLVYYAGLWAVLGWPESLLTWDILFLIPLVWAGPVLSAALVAASLVAAGLALLRAEAVGRPVRPDRWEKAGAVAAILLLLWAFMANHGAVRADGAPGAFPWIPYAIGFAGGWGVFLRAMRRARA